MSCANQSIVCLSIDPGTPLANGSHYLYYSVQDFCGNVSEGDPTSFVDPCPCTLTCPADITVTSCTNGASVFYMSSVAVSGSCDSTVIPQCVPPPGGFPMGTTVIHCTAMEPDGTILSCQFTITVLLDPVPPVPDLATLPTVTGQCSATVASADFNVRELTWIRE